MHSATLTNKFQKDGTVSKTCFFVGGGFGFFELVSRFLEKNTRLFDWCDR